MSLLKNYLRKWERTQAQIEHDWLAESHDLVDLERRQRILTNKKFERLGVMVKRLVSWFEHIGRMRAAR